MTPAPNLLHLVVVPLAASRVAPDSACHAQQSCGHGHTPCMEHLAQRCNMPDSVAKRRPSSGLQPVTPAMQSPAAEPHHRGPPQHWLCSTAVALAGVAIISKTAECPCSTGSTPSEQALHLRRCTSRCCCHPQQGRLAPPFPPARFCSSMGLTSLGCAPPPLGQAGDQPLVQHILGCGVADHDEGGQAAAPEALHMATGVC